MTTDELNNIVTSAEECGKFGDISDKESYSYISLIFILLFICIR